jgi:hypothetical protein
MTFRTHIQPLRWIVSVILIAIFGIGHLSWGEMISFHEGKNQFEQGSKESEGVGFYYEPPSLEPPKLEMEAQVPCPFGCQNNSNKAFMENIQDVRKVLGATLYTSPEKFGSNLKEVARLIGDTAAKAALHAHYRSYSEDPRTKKMISIAQGKPSYAEADPKIEGDCFKAVKLMLVAAGFAKEKWNEGMAKNAGPGLEALGFRNIYDPESPGPLKSCGDGPRGSICVYAPIDPGLKRRYGNAPPVEAAGHIEVYTGKSFGAQYRGVNPYDSYQKKYKLIGVYVMPPRQGS